MKKIVIFLILIFSVDIAFSKSGGGRNRGDLVDRFHSLRDSVNRRIFYNERALRSAIKEDDLGGILIVLQRNPNLSVAKDENGNTVAHFAAIRGYIPVFHFLYIKNKTHEIETLNDQKITPIKLAIKHERTELVRYLIENKDLFGLSFKHEELMNFARNRKLLDMFSFLSKLRTDKDVNELMKSSNARDLLVQFLKKGDQEMAISLIAKNKDLLKKDIHGENVLHIASSLGRPELVRRLVEEFEIDINSLNKKGESALHIASKRGFVEVVKVLVEKGSDLSIRNKKRETPLEVAKKKGRQEVVEFFKNFVKNRQQVIQERLEEGFKRSALRRDEMMQAIQKETFDRIQRENEEALNRVDQGLDQLKVSQETYQRDWKKRAEELKEGFQLAETEMLRGKRAAKQRTDRLRSVEADAKDMARALERKMRNEEKGRSRTDGPVIPKDQIGERYGQMVPIPQAGKRVRNNIRPKPTSEPVSKPPTTEPKPTFEPVSKPPTTQPSERTEVYVAKQESSQPPQKRKRRGGRSRGKNKATNLPQKREGMPVIPRSELAERYGEAPVIPRAGKKVRVIHPIGSRKERPVVFPEFKESQRDLMERKKEDINQGFVAEGNPNFQPYEVGGVAGQFIRSVSEGNKEKALKLIKKQRNSFFRVYDSGGWTAPHIAMFNGDVSMMNMLVRQGFTKDVRTLKEGRALLHFAFLKTRNEQYNKNLRTITILLLKVGAFPHVKNKNGWTLLHLAALRNDVALVRMLLEKGVDPMARTYPQRGISGKLAIELTTNAEIRYLIEARMKPL